MQQARDEIWQSWRYTCAENADHPRAKELFDRHVLPAFHDPFAGGGALPLEAQRLGLESYASDLNPVAVLINKAMIEIPPRFAGKPPVNPDVQKEGRSRRTTTGRARRAWPRTCATTASGCATKPRSASATSTRRSRSRRKWPKERPDLKKYVGQKLTVIAWLWARTVKSPNPAFAAVSTSLSPRLSCFRTKAGKEAYVEPVIEGGGYRFTVKVGKPKDAEGAKNGTKLASGQTFKCLMSGVPMTYDYIREEGKAGRMGATVDGHRCRGGSRTGLSCANAGDGSHCTDGTTDVAAGSHTAR